MLAQRLMGTTSPSLLYQCPDQYTKTYIRNITVANVTGGNLQYSLWINQGGTATGDQFCMAKSVTISANSTTQFSLYSDIAWVLDGASASLMGSSSAANGITFTVFGTEVTEL